MNARPDHKPMFPIFAAFFATLVGGALLTGCPKSAPQNAEKEAAVNQDPPPDYVVAMVNDTPLTWEEMERRAMGYMNQDIKQNHLIIPSNRLEDAKAFFRKRSISAFVMKTLTMDEARKSSITVTDRDRVKGLNLLAQTLKSRNMTTNDFFNNGPLPPEQMHREFEDGLVIDKLFEQKVGISIGIHNEEIDKVIAEIQATNEQKRVFMEDLRKKLVEGANFEEMAKKYSECQRSKDKGGDIGEIRHGNLTAKEMDKLAFSMPIGELSPVLQSNAGFHIMKVTARTPAVAATDTTPEAPETARVSHILIRQVPINRKKIMDTIRSNKFAAAKKEYYQSLLKSAKVTCFLYPDMVFE